MKRHLKLEDPKDPMSWLGSQDMKEETVLTVWNRLFQIPMTSCFPDTVAYTELEQLPIYSNCGLECYLQMRQMYCFMLGTTMDPCAGHKLMKGLCHSLCVVLYG